MLHIKTGSPANFLCFSGYEYLVCMTLQLKINLTTVQCVTYLDSFHGTDHQNSLHYTSTKPTQQAPTAVKSAGLILCMVAEELKHPKPEKKQQITVWDNTFADRCITKSGWPLHSATLQNRLMKQINVSRICSNARYKITSNKSQ